MGCHSFPQMMLQPQHLQPVVLHEACVFVQDGMLTVIIPPVGVVMAAVRPHFASQHLDAAAVLLLIVVVSCAARFFVVVAETMQHDLICCLVRDDATRIRACCHNQLSSSRFHTRVIGTNQ